LGLIGDLGAGKTVFTKGLAQGLGVKKVISSPTFVLMKVYRVNRSGKIKKLVHIDAYRLKNDADAAAIGISEYFSRTDTVAVIEWADKIKKVLPKNTKFIAISRQNKARVIKFSS